MATINITNALTGEVTKRTINESIAVGQRFRLIGRVMVFVANRVYENNVAGPMVRGVSECGRYGTAARVCDTVAV